MQGLDRFIPTEQKIDYLNQLLRVGFDTLDFGSFVSPKAVPQMKDTAEVLNGLELTDSSTSLLAIIANERGAIEALSHEQIAYLGYPMSISDTFQRRNTGKSIMESLELLSNISKACAESNRQLVVYLSMGFGNPYNDPYSVDIVRQFTGVLLNLGISIISLADTVGVATPGEISELFTILSNDVGECELGVHLHSNPQSADEKISAALDAGCQRIDGAILGLGGCPFAEDDLVGNINTRNIVNVLHSKNINSGLNMEEFKKSEILASELLG